MSTCDNKSLLNPVSGSKIETFAESIFVKKDRERSDEKKIGGGRFSSLPFDSVCGDSKDSNFEESSAKAENKNTKPFNEVNPAVINSPLDHVHADKCLPGVSSDSRRDEPNVQKPKKNKVETGYLTRLPKSGNLARNLHEINVKGEMTKMSSMEEEALRERTRMALLKQCSNYLAADGSSRYTRETFTRVFSEKVSYLFILFIYLRQDRFPFR